MCMAISKRDLSIILKAGAHTIFVGLGKDLAIEE